MVLYKNFSYREMFGDSLASSCDGCIKNDEISISLMLFYRIIEIIYDNITYHFILIFLNMSVK